MAAAVDPSYPLYPIACILAAAMLLLVLLTSFIRQRWNRGVAFLCFWLFFENLTGGINTILWADNADIKLYAYCDIVSRLQVMTSVVKPMATLIITRRLYLMASLQPVELPGEKMERRNLVIEWTLGLVIPVLVAGPFYYIVQYLRFQVIEGYGCQDAPDVTILSVLLINSWGVLPPLLSISIYYPRAALTLYRQSRDRDHFMHTQSNDSVSRTNYTRILILASIDILLTFPIGIASIVLYVTGVLSTESLPFYSGWTYTHMDWEPEVTTYAELTTAKASTSFLARFYFTQWTSPILAFTIFALFGITSEARVSYWRVICTVGGWCGWEPKARVRKGRASLGTIEFGEPPQEASLDAESGRRSSLFSPDAQIPERVATSESESAKREREASSEMGTTTE